MLLLLLQLRKCQCTKFASVSVDICMDLHNEDLLCVHQCSLNYSRVYQLCWSFVKTVQASQMVTASSVISRLLWVMKVSLQKYEPVFSAFLSVASSPSIAASTFKRNLHVQKSIGESLVIYRGDYQ